jgi:hypothetical protein
MQGKLLCSYKLTPCSFLAPTAMYRISIQSVRKSYIGLLIVSWLGSSVLMLQIAHSKPFIKGCYHQSPILDSPPNSCQLFQRHILQFPSQDVHNITLSILVFIHPFIQALYPWALTLIVLLTASGAPLSLISISKIPRCLTRSPSSVASTKLISSGPSTTLAPSSSSARIAFRLAAISAVETEP